MSAQDQFRQALEDGDVAILRGLWPQLMPHLPQPKTAADAEISMHMARTSADSVTIKGRCYSHRWLEERNLPSLLPDYLKPEVDRHYPRVVEAVGISVNFRSPFLKPAAIQVQGAMSDAVEDAYAEGRTDPEFVRARMAEAKQREVRRLFGGDRVHIARQI